MADKYREYFDLDENFFPQINETTIEKADWTKTYPHETFIKLLENVHGMLDGRTGRSIWIHGSYGTGKSQCAFALKKMFEVSEDELRAYWTQPSEKTWPLNKKPDLLTKICGHKSRKIVTAYRYGSGGINSTGQLLLAVQESIKKALIDQNVAYKGEGTLKDSVIAWIEKPAQKAFFNNLLSSDKYNHWPQATADEVLSELRKGGDIRQLMDNVFDLAQAEGITALNLTTESLVEWIKDIIKENDIKLVLIWDEFSAYFKGNRNSLDQFQKLAELCEERFYFVIVTHETSGLITANDKTWEVVKQRFDFSEITLPDGIAFELISHARKVKTAAKSTWEPLAEALNARVPHSRKAVMTEARVTDETIIKGLMPLHPMGAIALKYIAEAFQSNQRSIFNFMSQEIDGIETFQWFVANTAPDDDFPLLTIDRLWNYFYDHHKDELTPDVRSILDTFTRQQGLRAEQATVLKTILIMQAINHRLGDAIGLFRVSDQNLRNAFEGNEVLEGNRAVNVAKQLVEQGVLHKKPIGNNEEVYAALPTISNTSKINSYKEDIRKSINTANLVIEGGLADVLDLSNPLKLRYEDETAGEGKIKAVTPTDFTSTMNKLSQKPNGWKFYAVIAFAKDESEAVSFRKAIEVAVKNPDYSNIIVVDALSVPLGADLLEQYITYSANAMYYHNNEGQLERENMAKAKRVLDTEWKNSIANGSFIVYSTMNPNGERVTNRQGVLSIMEAIVKAKYPDIFDFVKGLSGTMLKPSQVGASAKCGAMQISSGAVKDIEKFILPTVWRVPDYHNKQATLPISRIKGVIDKKIQEAFSRDGRISIAEIYGVLEDDFGFAPCNLSAFLAGFLLKEYACEPYRYYDSRNGQDSMSTDKIKEMLGNHIGKDRPIESYLVKMTDDEMAFYNLTEQVWGSSSNSCDIALAASSVKTKMHQLGLPVWCLSEVDDSGVYDIVEKYIEFVQTEGKDAHQKAIEIGKIAKIKSTLATNLITLVTKQKCQEGMRIFLSLFEDGKIAELATKIGAEATLISDIEKLFSAADWSCIWSKVTGENEIRRLLTDYGFVYESNKILATGANSLSKCKSDWRDKLKFISISAEHLRTKFPALVKLFDFLIKINNQKDIPADQFKTFYDELAANSSTITEFFNNEKAVFAEIYAPYIEGLSDDDVYAVKSDCGTGMFSLGAIESNSKVKTKAEEFRQGQVKTKLFLLWQNQTGTQNPREWSTRYKLPILCMVMPSEYDSAKKTFETLNRNNPSNAEIEEALTFLQTAKFFATLNDDSKRVTAFTKGIIGKYAKVLPDVVKVQNDLDRLALEPYDWYRHPAVNARVRELAQAEYNSGGSDVVMRKIDSMGDAEAKSYLKRLIRENMTVGLEIIEGGADERE